MHVSLLETFLISQLFAFIFIFCRVGTGIMLLPGVGETYVPMTLRLAFALAMSLMLVPLLQPLMPEVPGSPLALFILVTGEILVGLFLGFLARLLVTVMHIAGSIISYQSSLALASILDISQAGQSTVIGNFLTLTAVTLFFSLNLHHVMLDGLVDSYQLFTPGSFPIVGDMMDHLFRVFSQVFMIGIQLSAPHIVFALLFYLCAGILSRLMPAMQVFFILMPAQIMIAFFLLIAIMTSIMLNYAQFAEETLGAFMGD